MKSAVIDMSWEDFDNMSLREAWEIINAEQEKLNKLLEEYTDEV